MSPVEATSRPTGSMSVQGDLWSVRARDYAEIQERTFLPLYENVLRRPELANAMSLLDVGCGPGLAVQTLGRMVGRTAGIDASPAFIEIARSRAPQSDFRVGEMEALPHADETFDVVTSATVNSNIATVDPAQFPQPLRKCLDLGARLRIVFG